MNDGTFDLLPPHDINTEQVVLGSAMLSADAAATVDERLSEADFVRPAHKITLRAVKGLLDRGEAVNPISVNQELQQYRGDWAIPTGLDLNQMTQVVPTVANIGYHVDALRAYSMLRSLTEVGPTITRLGYNSPADGALSAVEQAQKLFDDATRHAVDDDGDSVPDIIGPFMENLEKPKEDRGVTTGLTDLDAILKRLRPGQLVTVGARPGVGKSALMACFAHHVAVKLGQPVYVATLEMSTEECLGRIVSLDCKVDLAKILDPESLTEDDWRRLSGAYERLSEANIVINDKASLGISQIRAGIRKMRRAKKPPALVIVDYLQLMRGAGRSENRQAEVADMSRSLKMMAQEFEVPIVIGSQLNRNVEQRQDKRPTAADLRESGAVEQDSDVVLLLNRPEIYEQESPRAGEIDVIVEKNRSGARGTAVCTFQGQYSRVVNLAWSPSRNAS